MATISRGAARGVIGAMAMSGLRRMTTTVGLVRETPPESILREGTPPVFYRVPEERRPALVEAVHWSYGALGGALFGLLPQTVRRYGWIGPVYGMVFWAGFQFVIAPVLGLPHSRRIRVPEQLSLLGDHLLYGMVVAASPWPHEDKV